MTRDDMGLPSLEIKSIVLLFSPSINPFEGISRVTNLSGPCHDKLATPLEGVLITCTRPTGNQSCRTNRR